MTLKLDGAMPRGMSMFSRFRTVALSLPQITPEAVPAGAARAKARVSSLGTA